MREKQLAINNKQSFTLIELLVVITIIGLLSGIGMAVFANVQRKGRDAQRRADLRKMQEAVELYYATNNEYPTTNNVWWAQCVIGEAGSQVRTGTCQADAIIDGICSTSGTSYIEAIPTDPKFGIVTAARCYAYRSDGANYKIVAWGAVESLTAVPSTDEMYDPHPRTTSFAVYSPSARSW